MAAATAAPRPSRPRRPRPRPRRLSRRRYDGGAWFDRMCVSDFDGTLLLVIPQPRERCAGTKGAAVGRQLALLWRTRTLPHPTRRGCARGIVIASHRLSESHNQRRAPAIGACGAARWVSSAWFSQALIAAERLARAMRYALARRATLPEPSSAVLALGC